MEDHQICCFHTVRVDSYGDSKTEVAHCCDCPKNRVRQYGLVSMANHGPRAPKVMKMLSERIVG